jgi:signal transduction histidine kinase
LESAHLDLAPVVHDAVEAVRVAAAAKRVELEVAADSGTGFVWGDRERLQQVLWNLLSNAVKFTPSPGSVTIKTAYDTLDGVKIEVSDTGVGMAPADLARALEPYAQVHRRHANDEPGTGLGLPLAKALTEANHARFAIESTPDNGTRVTIVFPAAQIAEGAAGI